MSVLELTDAPAWSERDLDRLRELVRSEESSAWEIGDELLALLPITERAGAKDHGVGRTIRKLASEVDAEPQAFTRYRAVAHSWPSGTRVPEATWAAHRAYCGPPATAADRARTLRSLPRNEHGKITVAAVKELTKGTSRGKPGWAELLGQVGDTLIRAQKELAKFEDATAGREVNPKLRNKAGEYAEMAQSLAARLRVIKDCGPED